MFHPNVDEASGSVCLDVINQTWSPMYELVNVFAVFLPQLLLYPNPTDPLNGAAAALLMKDKKAYETRVKEYVKKYASQDISFGDEDEDDEEENVPMHTIKSSPSSAGSDSPKMMAIDTPKEKQAPASKSKVEKDVLDDIDAELDVGMTDQLSDVDEPSEF
jgi:hypothetical protein